MDKAENDEYNIAMSSELEHTEQGDTLQNKLALLLSEAGVPNEIGEQYLAIYNYYEQVGQYRQGAPGVVLPDNEPSELSSDILNMYSIGHENFYRPHIQELVDTYGEWDLLVMRSGMYGGKSSCVFDLIDKLKEMGINSTLLISSQMGEGYITGRGFRNGEKRRSAKRFGGYGLSDPEELRKRVFLEEIANNQNPLLVVDEYTFADADEITTLMNVAKAYQKKLILLGLDTNYLGDELPIFRHPHFIRELQDKRTRILDCYSYVNSSNIELPPNGKGTIRYLKVGNRWVLDLGLGQLIISKVNAGIVRYFPSIKTLKDILRGNEFFTRILRDSANDNSQLAQVQRAITGVLIERNSSKN